MGCGSLKTGDSALAWLIWVLLEYSVFRLPFVQAKQHALGGKRKHNPPGGDVVQQALRQRADLGLLLGQERRAVAIGKPVL